MKKYFLLSLILPLSVFAQIDLSYFFQQEYNKERTEFLAKDYLLKRVFEKKTTTIKFELDALSAAQSNELTTLYYNCNDLNLEGLLLAFYGNYSNQNGVNFLGYAFKNFDKKSAFNLFNKIQNEIDTNAKYLKEKNENNIAFKFEDIDVIISNSAQTAYQIRLFWNGFDATWDAFAFSRSKKRMNYKVDNN